MIIFQFAVEKERKKLRAEFTYLSLYPDTLEDMIRTIPKCPSTLAAVCRRWRNIALHNPKLWSFIRVYTLSPIARLSRKKLSKCHWVGKAAFEWSLQRAKGTPLELTIYDDFDLEPRPPSLDIPSDTRISIIHLVRLGCIPWWLPSCLHLSLYDNTPAWSYRMSVPPFFDEPKEISCTNILPFFVAPSDCVTGFKFCSEYGSQILDLKHLSGLLPKLETLQLLLPEVTNPPTNSTIRQAWKSLTTLIATSSALHFLAVHAETGLSLPSLTTLILTNIFASFKPNKHKDIKHIVKTITSLEIHNISSSIKPSELRNFINWMERLKTITFHHPPVQKIMRALSITPAKLVESLRVEGMVLEGAGLQVYTAILKGS